MSASLADGLIRAGELTAEHIGKLIRFCVYDINREISTVITAELRQVNHLDGTTFINVGHGAEYEQVVDPDMPIMLYPRDNYADMSKLLDAIAKSGVSK